MKKFVRSLLLLAVLVAIATPVYASSGIGVVIPPDFMDWLTNLLFVVIPTLVGVAALITVLINVLKTAGVVKDSTSVQWSAGLNLAAIVILVLLKIFKPDLTYDFIDKTAGQVANILIVITAYVFQIILSGKTQDVLRGIPVIGKSLSQDNLAKFKKNLPAQTPESTTETK